MILEKILDIQNKTISVIEIFLGAFEVSELVQNWIEGRLNHNIVDTPELHFIKILTDEIFAAPFFLRIART